MEDIINEAENGVQLISNLTVDLDQVRNELQANPKFIEFLRLQDELNEQRSKFDSTMKQLMIDRYLETGEKKLEVDNAIFSLTPREELVADDIELVPDVYVDKVIVKKLNKEAVKATQVLEGRLVDGVGIKRSYAYKLNIKEQ